MQTAFLTEQTYVPKSVDLRQLAVRYVKDAIGAAFTVAKLRLQHDQKKWWALIQYQATGQCRPIGVGRLEIDAESGQLLPLSSAEIQVICEKAAIVEARQRQVTPINPDGYVIGEFARKQASRYLWDHLGMHYGAIDPLFLPSDPPLWQVTIIFRMYELGPFSVGIMKIEAQSGEPIVLTEVEIKQIKERVYAIVGSQTSAANPE